MEKNHLDQQRRKVISMFQEAATRIAFEAEEVGVSCPPTAQKILSASHHDLYSSQHIPTSLDVVESYIEMMEEELDDLLREKLLSILALRGIDLTQDPKD